MYLTSLIRTNIQTKYFVAKCHTCNIEHEKLCSLFFETTKGTIFKKNTMCLLFVFLSLYFCSTKTTSSKEKMKRLDMYNKIERD